MTDFYVMLGLMRTATPEQIRAAYLERMKVLHPDRHAPCPDGAPSAADLNLAYWTLRDPERRAAYDRKLAPLPPKPRRSSSSSRRSSQIARSPRRPLVKKAYYPRRSSYSPRTRAIAAVVLVVLSAAAGAGTMALWRAGQGQAAWARSAGTAGEAAARRDQRRVLDESLASSAAAEFQALLHRSGFPGASLYGRQCFDELSLQPSVEMVDYCLAFDRAGAEWEQALVTDGDRRRYFDAAARLGRYKHLADQLGEGPVRQAILAEAAFLGTR